MTGDGDAGQAGASVKRPFPDGFDTGGNGEDGQTGVSLKCGIANGGDALLDGDALQSAVVRKRAVTDGAHRAGDDDAFQGVVARKCALTDGGHCTGDRDAGEVHVLERARADRRDPAANVETARIGPRLVRQRGVGHRPAPGDVQRSGICMAGPLQCPPRAADGGGRIGRPGGGGQQGQTQAQSQRGQRRPSFHGDSLPQFRAPQPVRLSSS